MRYRLEPYVKREQIISTGGLYNLRTGGLYKDDGDRGGEKYSPFAAHERNDRFVWTENYVRKQEKS